MLNQYRLWERVTLALIFLVITTWTTRISYAAHCNLSQAVETHQRLDNFLEQKFDHYWYGTKPSSDYRPRRIENIIAELPTDSAILFYVLSTEPDFISPPQPILDRTPPTFLCVWLFDRDRPVTQVEIALDADSGQELLGLADNIRSSLLLDDPSHDWRAPPTAKRVVVTTETAGSPRLPSAALARAAEFLLPGGIRQSILSRNYHRLVVVPSRNFGSIPYAALPIDNERQLVDLVSIVVMPSFPALADSGTMQPVIRSLVVGDPELKRGDKLVRPGMFARLPGAQEEAEVVAKLLGVRPLLGADASQKAVLPAVLNSDLIYFATHGIANDKDPNDRSYLLLSDGALTARNIAKLRMRQRPIVVMSACQTGLGKTFESGVIGLAKAWKYAGAARVIMTLWSVYDTPTRNLMADFISNLKNGMPEDFALQSAMRTLKGKSPYSHPLYWAGFMVYGAPAPTI